MSKYYIDFVGLNTFIYEPNGDGDYPDYLPQLVLNANPDVSGLPVDIFTNWPEQIFTDIQTEDITIMRGSGTTATDQANVSLNTIGASNHHILPVNMNNTLLVQSSNGKFLENVAQLPSTASYFTAINLKRNGPYGYPSWRQIRSGENPIIRSQKRKNIMTVVPKTPIATQFLQSTNQYSAPSSLEIFREPVVSTNDMMISLTSSRTSQLGFKVRYLTDSEFISSYTYFDNRRLNQILAPFDYSNVLQTDPALRDKLKINFSRIAAKNNRTLESFTYRDTIYPPRVSTRFDKRTRTTFNFNWKNNFDSRFNGFAYLHPHANYAAIGSFGAASGVKARFYTGSMWPLDAHQDFETRTGIQLFATQMNDASVSVSNSGILQNVMAYEEDVGNSGPSRFSRGMSALPLYSHKHTITPLTSCVGPFGMDIEGVNDGTLFSDLAGDELLSGEAFWDAPGQYGKGPYHDSYSETIEDIKRVARGSTIIPEFRSSVHFLDLLNNSGRTPEGFLEVTGGFATQKTTSTSLSVGGDQVTTVSSSADSDFFSVYSHSDFIKNFDVAAAISDQNGVEKLSIKVKCAAIKKFVPYNGFYPAQRTIDIANEFTVNVYPNCTLREVNGGITTFAKMSLNSDSSPVMFNNILKPMFGPGILYNSIKSGIAVDYPIHTASLELHNGVKLLGDSYYIERPFDQRIPFEALLEPNLISNIEIHSSEPHPSGNLSGSARWSGAGDLRQYKSMIHNFLAETADFFMEDQTFSFIASDVSQNRIVSMVSGNLYAFDVRLYKTQNVDSEPIESGIQKFDPLFMTGSGVKETFTMYSRPSAFGPPSRITSSFTIGGDNMTGSYSDLGYNWSFTPPYYDGASRITFGFYAPQTRTYTYEEIFAEAFQISQRIGLVEKNNDTFRVGDRFAHSNAMLYLNDTLDIYKFAEQINIAGASKSLFQAAHYGSLKDNVCNINASININLGVLKDGQLTDFQKKTTSGVTLGFGGQSNAFNPVGLPQNTPTAQVINASGQKNVQFIIQTKWETPMFNFKTHGNSEDITMPSIGKQSVPRGIWHQYAPVNTSEKEGIFMQIADSSDNFVVKFIADSVNVPVLPLAPLLGLDDTPVQLGKVSPSKTVSEAIVAVPFLGDTYNPNSPTVEGRREFFSLPRQEINAALAGDLTNATQGLIDMVNNMQRFVMPPMFNFIEDPTIDPKAMYIFPFDHTFDQDDIAAIWQNLPPKLMSSFEKQEVSVEHELTTANLLRTSNPTIIGNQFGGNIIKDEPERNAKNFLKKTKWLVFKVKQKAAKNYFDKIIDNGSIIYNPPKYGHNWPYDFFSLVELASVQTDIKFEK